MITAPAGDEPVVGLMEHYARANWTELDVDSEFHARIRAGGEKLAVDGHDALCDQVGRTLRSLEMSLPGMENRGVRMPHWGPWAVSLDDYLVSVDEIERRTGLDFLSELPDAAEDALEARKVPRAW